MISFIKKYLSSYEWDLAFGPYDEKTVYSDISTIPLKFVNNPYKDKWFADPFILEVDGIYIHLLVEEFDKKVKKGRIAHITIDMHTGIITGCKIILELDTHLSFPAIYRINNDIYVHPENSASGRSTIYRYDTKQDKLVDPVVLVEAPLTDAIIVKDDDSFLIYSTMLPQNGGPLLHVYKSISFLGPYDEISSIDFGNKTARMAGWMLETKAGQIRPSQDCRHDYGEAVIFYKGHTVVGELRSTNKKYAGLHTFNTMFSIFVIDLKKYKHPILRNIIKRVLGRK